VRTASISALKFEAIKKGKIQKTGVVGRVAAIIEGKIMNLSVETEGGDRGGDELRRIDGGRHGPGVANAATVRNPVRI
jgi:hypothetical protein